MGYEAVRPADKLSAHAIPCVFLGFSVDSPDHAYYHPPLHQFLDSRDIRFDESVSYYACYPCQGLPVPPPPLFLAPSPPPAPAPPVPPGAGAGGAGTGGASSGGAGAGGADAGGASSGGARAGGAGAGGAISGGAGAGGAGAGGASSRGAGAGGTSTRGASSKETRAGGITFAPPHRHDTHLQAARQREREEQEWLEQERQELRGLRALDLPSAPPVHSQSPTAYGPTSPPPDSALAIFSPPQSWSSPPDLPHDWTTRCPPRALLSSPFDDFRTVLFCSSSRRALLVSILPPHPASSLTVSSHPITDYCHLVRPVVLRVLASLVTDPRASPSSLSDLTAAVADFASTRRLDFATRVVAAPPARPLSTGG
ncbi:unnamed protein product [Closterium sp. NIES-54]